MFCDNRERLGSESRTLAANLRNHCLAQNLILSTKKELAHCEFPNFFISIAVF